MYNYLIVWFLYKINSFKVFKENICLKLLLELSRFTVYLPKIAPTIISAISTFLESLEPFNSAGVGLLLNTGICWPVPKPKLLLFMEIGAAAEELWCLNASNVSYLSKFERGVGDVVPRKKETNKHKKVE